MVHIPGVKNKATDCLSRHPTGKPDKMVLSDDIACMPDIIHASALMGGLRIIDETEPSQDDAGMLAALPSLHALQSVTWEWVRTATSSDPYMQTLLEMIESGIPENRQDVPEPLREYFPFREQLHTSDGVVLYKDRVVIPPTLRHEVLESLHSAHQGVTAMTARAESSIFWPGITPAISNIRSTCQQCNRIAPSNPSAPPTPLANPEYPFQCVCADFFHYKGCNFLLEVDRYSNWPIV